MTGGEYVQVGGPRPSLGGDLELAFALVAVEVRTRHFQKALGVFWWVLDPLLMAFLYFFLVQVVLQAADTQDYLLRILSLVFVWRWFSRSVDAAPGMLLEYASILRQTNFPRRVIPLATATREFVYFLFGLAALLAIYPLLGQPLRASLAFLPVLFVVQYVFILGVSTFLGAAGVHLRDLSHVVYLGTSVWFYLTPAIYTAARIERLATDHPWVYRLYRANPWATLMPAWEAVLLDGRIPPLAPLAGWFAVFCLGAAGGYATFLSLTRRSFKVL